MATSTVAKTRERLKTIIEGVTGMTASRVKLGVVDLSPTDEFFNDIVSSGPYAVILPAQWGDRAIGMANTAQQPYEFDIDVLIYFGYAKNANYTYTDIEDLISLILTSLGNKSQYTSGAAMPFRGIAIELDEEINETPRVGMYTLTLKCAGGD